MDEPTPVAAKAPLALFANTRQSFAPASEFQSV
jgi:hypothetical protein